MKSFVVIFLFAFLAGIHGDEFEELLMANDGDPDRHPYVQCKIDLYDCVKAGDLTNTECLVKYKSCMAVLMPTLPPIVTNCSNKLYDCVKAGKGKLECIKEYSSCMSALIPPFVRVCNNHLKQCFKDEKFLAGKAKCLVSYGKCIKNKGPVTEASMDTSNDGEPDRHPFVQCKIDFYDCMRRNDTKLRCLKEYKNCMAALIPTIPPFVITCKNNFKQCLNAAAELAEKAKCFKDFGKCLINKGPAEIALDAIQDVGQAEDVNGLKQCTMDFYQCYKNGTDVKTCSAEYNACLAALIPEYMKQCYATAQECFKTADTPVDKYGCFKDLRICIKNGASS